MGSKRGQSIVWGELIPWLIGIFVFVVVVLVYLDLQGRGIGIIQYLKNLMRLR